MPNQAIPAAGSATNRIAAANYLAALSADLAALARQHGLVTLGYILDMARLEAENESRRGRGNGR